MADSTTIQSVAYAGSWPHGTSVMGGDEMENSRSIVGIKPTFITFRGSVQIIIPAKVLDVIFWIGVYYGLEKSCTLYR